MLAYRSRACDSTRLALLVLLLTSAAGCRTRPIGVVEPARPRHEQPWPMQGRDVRHRSASPSLGPRSPHLRWKRSTGDIVSGSPVVAADGTVVVGSYDGNLYAFDGKSGATRWTFHAGGTVGASAALSDDDVI